MISHENIPSAVFIAGVALAASPAQAQQAGLPMVRHLVYRFGYNTSATKSGTGTGTTTSISKDWRATAG